MTVVTRRGQYALGDANLARGAGETSLNSPNRSNLDWQSSLAETAQDAGDKIRGVIEGVLDGAVQEIYDLTGIDLSSIVNLLNQLLTSPLDSLGSVGLGDVLSVLGQFLPFLPGVDPSSFDPAAAATQFINSILNPTGLLANWPQLYQVITGANGALNELGELFQQGLFGQINPGRLGQISAAAIDNLNPETLDNPGFDTDASIRDNEEVEWDGTFGRTRPGSMKVVADGTTHTAISNPLRVVASRTVNVEIWTYYVGVTANPGTTPIRLSVAAFDAPVIDGGPPVWVADTLIPAPSIASPAGNSSAVAGNVGGWVKIVGSYTVPAGVDRVVNKVQVTEDCLSGTVHFDDGSRKRAGLLPKEYVEGLLADLAAHAAKIQATLNKGWEALTGLPAAVDKTVDDLKAALQNIPQANVAGLAAALASAGQDIRDAIVNAITGGSGTGHSTGDVIAALLNIPQHLINGLEDDLADAGDAIADVWDDVRDTWNKVVGGYRRTTVTGQTSTDVEEVMISVGQEILVAQESTITLANQANAPRNVPFWVSPNRFEEVSFPRALLQPVPSIGSGGSGTTGTGSGLTVLDANWNAEESDAVRNHTHSTPSHSHALSYVKPTFTIPDGTLALTAITMTQDRLVNVSRFLAGGGTPPSTALYIGLYAIDPATGTMTLVYDYGDQKGQHQHRGGPLRDGAEPACRHAGRRGGNVCRRDLAGRRLIRGRRCAASAHRDRLGDLPGGSHRAGFRAEQPAGHRRQQFDEPHSDAPYLGQPRPGRRVDPRGQQPRHADDDVQRVEHVGLVLAEFPAVRQRQQQFHRQGRQHLRWRADGAVRRCVLCAFGAVPHPGAHQRPHGRDHPRHRLGRRCLRLRHRPRLCAVQLLGHLGGVPARRRHRRRGAGAYRHHHEPDVDRHGARHRLRDCLRRG